MNDRLSVKFLFYPADSSSRQIVKQNGQWTIQKADENGVKRNYLCGISSGMNTDAHGDYMSESCIKSFHKQALEKEVLLYVNHGKDFTGDIGRLEKSEIIERDGVKHWYTEYALYGDSDNVPDENKQQAEHVYRQAAGLPPYKKARQLGFSIEGFIDPSTIQQTAKGREIGYVDLDPGVTVVTKPAYTESIATAIAKSLYQYSKRLNKAEATMPQEEPNPSDDISETTEDQQNLGGEYAIHTTPDNQFREEKSIQTAKNRFNEIIEQHRKDDSFYNGKWEIEDALRDGIDQVLEAPNMNADQKKQEINDIIDSYKASTLALFDQYGYDQIGDEQPSDNTSTTGSDDAPLARARKAVARLKSLTKGQKNMNQELKTILSDVIASLQMLMQGEQEEVESPEMVEGAVKQEEEPEGDEATMKSLMALARLLKEEGAGSAEGKAEDIIEEAQPEITPDEAEKFEKMLRALRAKKSRGSDPELRVLKSQVSELTKGFENLLKGFGIDRAIQSPEPVKKGLASHSGYEILAKQLAEITSKLNKEEETPHRYNGPRTPIQKNANDVMDGFRQLFGKEV